jgi:hypothetical protein
MKTVCVVEQIWNKCDLNETRFKDHQDMIQVWSEWDPKMMIYGHIYVLTCTITSWWFFIRFDHDIALGESGRDNALLEKRKLLGIAIFLFRFLIADTLAAWLPGYPAFPAVWLFDYLAFWLLRLLTTAGSWLHDVLATWTFWLLGVLFTWPSGCWLPGYLSSLDVLNTDAGTQCDWRTVRVG